MLYIIGIGLGNEKDITLAGLEAIKKCSKVYLEYYTSMMKASKEQLEQLYQKEIILANRSMIENQSQQLLDQASMQDIAILVIGDPLSATTHSGLVLEAKKQNIKVKVIHNASVLNAVGSTGLQLYKFGKVSSIPFHETDVPYQNLELNKQVGLHSLFLLDLDPANHKAMSAAQAAKILLSLEEKHGKQIISPLTTAIVCARLGTDDELIFAGPLSAISQKDFGNPLHSLIIPGEMHFLEEDWIKELQKS